MHGSYHLPLHCNRAKTSANGGNQINLSHFLMHALPPKVNKYHFDNYFLDINTTSIGLYSLYYDNVCPSTFCPFNLNPVDMIAMLTIPCSMKLLFFRMCYLADVQKVVVDLCPTSCWRRCQIHKAKTFLVVVFLHNLYSQTNE